MIYEIVDTYGRYKNLLVLSKKKKKLLAKFKHIKIDSFKEKKKCK